MTIPTRDEMRLELILEVNAIKHLPGPVSPVRMAWGTFDWLEFPKHQMAPLWWMGHEMYWTDPDD